MAAPDVKVRITAEDNASAKIVDISTRFRTLRESSEEAGRGLGRIGNILGDMARNAIGATGPLGRIAEKLIEFGIGGGLFVAVAAGITGLYLLYEKLGDGAKKAREEVDKLIVSLNKSAETKTETAFANEIVLKDRIAALRKELADIQPRLDYARATNQKDVAARLEDQVATLSVQLAQARRALAAARGGPVELPDLKVTPKTDKQLLDEYIKLHGLNPNPNAVTTARGNMMPSDRATNDGAPFTAPPDFQAGDNFGPTQFADGITKASDGLKEITDGLKNFSEGATSAFDTAIEGAQLFGLNLGGIKKGLGIYAAVHGAYDEVMAISAFARGLFGDPTQFKAAATAQVSAARWFSLAAKYGSGSGGGGSFAASGGGGGLSSNGFTSQQQAAQNRDKINIVLQKGYISSTDPDFQDWLATTLNNATGRGVQITVSGVAA